MKEEFDFGLLNSQTDERYGSRPYGLLGTIAKNGCGMIALYNIERAADDKTRFEPYYADRKQIRTNLFGLLGTRPSAINKRLRKKAFEVVSIRLKDAGQAEMFDGVIVLSWYFFGAHYVAGIGNDSGTYTFYNQFVRPRPMKLTEFLHTLKDQKQHVLRIWGVRFPKKQSE